MRLHGAIVHGAAWRSRGFECFHWDSATDACASTHARLRQTREDHDAEARPLHALHTLHTLDAGARSESVRSRFFHSMHE